MNDEHANQLSLKKLIIGTILIIFTVIAYMALSTTLNLAKIEDISALKITRSPSVDTGNVLGQTTSPTIKSTGLFPTVTIRADQSQFVKNTGETYIRSVIPDPNKTISLHPISDPVLALDDVYIYWLSVGEIFRSPLGKVSKELVVSSIYPKGDLSRMDPIRTGNWLIFLDAQDPNTNNFSTWSLRALNLSDHTEENIARSLNSPALLTAFSFGADQDWVAWTEVNHSSSHACEEDTLTVFDLKTKVSQVLEQSCIENNYLLTMPKVSGNFLAVEQDFPDAQGGGSNLLLYDLLTGERKTLSEDGKSSMPQFEYPWVIWKENRRFDSMMSFRICNLEDGKSWSVAIDATDATDPHLSQQRVYWTEMRPSSGTPLDYNSIYIYDINLNQTLVLNPPGVNQRFREVIIHDNTLAWLRDLNASSSTKDGVIEWNTISIP